MPAIHYPRLLYILSTQAKIYSKASSFFFKRYSYLREKHAIISIPKHSYEPNWQIPLGVRAIGQRLAAVEQETADASPLLPRPIRWPIDLLTTYFLSYPHHHITSQSILYFTNSPIYTCYKTCSAPITPHILLTTCPVRA